MQKTSSNYERIIRSGEPRYRYKVDIAGVGSFEDELKSVKTTLRVFEEDPQIGKAVAGEVDITMLNPSAVIPKMACLRVYVRAYGTVEKSSVVSVENEQFEIPSGASVSGESVIFSPTVEAAVVGETVEFPVDGEEYIESEWLPQGVFFIDTRKITANENNLDILTIHGFDAMLKAEQDYSSNAVVGDNYDTAYVQAIADAIGVNVDSRTWTVMQGGHLIPFPLGYSMREILGMIAGIYIGSFIITEEGKLRLVSLTELPQETNLLITEDGDVLVFGTDAILI